MDIRQRVENLKDEIIAFRRYIHQNPELAGCEIGTSKRIAQELKRMGLEVQSRDEFTGVVAVLQGSAPGKTLALRADMDALQLQEDTGLDFASQKPGVAHACGHDIHTAVLLGCAKVLSGVRASFKGNIKFIFQPAEEQLTGALQMIKAGVLHHPEVDAIMALHCWPELPVGTVGLKSGAFMAAADDVDITIMGKPGHAAHPHKCIDPVVIAAHIVTTLQTVVSREIAPLDSAVLTIGKITGGAARNIIPAAVEMYGTIRTLSPALREKMPAVLERIISKTAESMGGEASVDYRFGNPPVINDSELVALLDEAASRALGKDHVVYLEMPSMGGEDFSYYLADLPGVLFRLGTANENPQTKLALHNPKLIFDERAIATGITVMSEAALAYLERNE